MTEPLSQAKLAAQRLKQANPDHFKNIGAKGGNAPKSKPGGFAVNRELARYWGERNGPKRRVRDLSN